jgi:Fe-S-cluster containining protein
MAGPGDYTPVRDGTRVRRILFVVPMDGPGQQRFALSIHQGFECQHSGACCTSGWAIPVEAPLHQLLGEAMRDGRLRVPGQDAKQAFGPLLTPTDPFQGCSVILKTDATGTCAFFDRGAGNLCAIQRRLGHDHLPSACRHFPRVCLTDSRGLFVTLSHYCPTVARALVEDATRLEIVSDPAVLRSEMSCEGLDARRTFPPLLRPNLLMDLGSYDLFERYMVRTLGREDLSPEAALQRIAFTAEDIRYWTVGEISLVEHVRDAIEVGDSLGRDLDSPEPAAATLASLYAQVTASVPPGLTRPEAVPNLEHVHRSSVRRAWAAFRRPVSRYLAAKGFASWLAYQGQGVRTIVFSMAVALAVLKVEAAQQSAQAGRALDRDLLLEAFRAADLLLVHLASREDLARRLSAVETKPAAEFLAATGLTSG